MKLSHKIVIAVSTAIIIGGLLLYTRKLSSDVISSHTMISDSIREIDILDRMLDDEILKSSFLLYHNYDGINKAMRQIYRQLAEVMGQQTLENCPKTLALLKRYQEETLEKERQVRVFQTVNSPIKNSAMYIPRLELKFREDAKFADNQYLRQLSHITSSIFLARNSLDTGFVDEIARHTDVLRSYDFKDQESRDFNAAFIAHASVFSTSFPAYSDSMTRILNSGSKEILQQTMRVFSDEERNQGLMQLNLLSFVLLTALLASLVLILNYAVQLDRQRRAQVQAEKQHFLEKEKMLKDLHDGLGGSLSNAAMLVDMMRRESDPDRNAAQLNKLKSITTEGLTELREIIWSLDGRESTLGSTIAYVQEKVVGSIGLPCRLDISLENELIPVSPLIRLNLAKVIKEALTNVLKHAEAKSLQVAFSETGGVLSMLIRDDGKGFDPVALQEQIGTGYGMRNMMKRCEDIGARFEISSSPAQGTTISVQLCLA